MSDYGLCLSGGGGKGAYQIGVFKALHELGIDSQVKAVSGSSIGAINGLFFVLKRFEDAEKIWEAMGEKVNLLGASDMQALRKSLIDTLVNDVDYNVVRSSETALYATVSIQNRELGYPDTVEKIWDYVNNYSDYFETRHLKLNELSDEEIKNRILASSALPVVYPSITLNGEKAIDGGLTCNVPIRPLIEDEEVKKLIIVMVGVKNEYDLYLASRADEIIEIRPSKPIGDFVDGTIDFSTKSVKRRMLLGYYDTLRAFEIAKRRSEGNPYTDAEKAQMVELDYNKVMAELNVAMVAKQSQSVMREFDDLLGKYGKKYGIDLKNLQLEKDS